MCGRSRCALDPERLKQVARTNVWPDQELYQPSHNVTPGRDTPVAFCTPDGKTELGMMTWGLIPSFTSSDAKVDHWKMFNARSESVAEKAAFRRLIPSRRCIVYLNGFYEWKKDAGSGRKQPYYIYLENDEPMAMAGLYDVWRSEDGRKLKTYTILTTDSGKKLGWLHDRMPVILKTDSQRQLWMDTTNSHSIEYVLGLVMRPSIGCFSNLRSNAFISLLFFKQKIWKSTVDP